MLDDPTTADQPRTPSGAVLRADHPWDDAFMAGLYDLFPFDGDLPLYRELAAAQGGEVLELACGSGRVLVPLVRAGNRVMGLDASAAMLALAREKLVAAGSEVAERARLVEDDMRDFRLGHTFDFALVAVKSFAYLQTAADQLEALACIASHLRPGGLLALDLLHPSLEWLAQSPGSLRQDLVRRVPEWGVTVARTETAVSTDRAAQVRVIRSAYELVGDD